MRLVQKNMYVFKFSVIIINIDIDGTRSRLAAPMEMVGVVWVVRCRACGGGGGLSKKIILFHAEIRSTLISLHTSLLFLSFQSLVSNR